jgi:hypothetical protein
MPATASHKSANPYLQIPGVMAFVPDKVTHERGTILTREGQRRRHRDF